MADDNFGKPSINIGAFKNAQLDKSKRFSFKKYIESKTGAVTSSATKSVYFENKESSASSSSFISDKVLLNVPDAKNEKNELTKCILKDNSDSSSYSTKENGQVQRANETNINRVQGSKLILQKGQLQSRHETSVSKAEPSPKLIKEVANDKFELSHLNKRVNDYQTDEWKNNQKGKTQSNNSGKGVAKYNLNERKYQGSLLTDIPVSYTGKSNVQVDYSSLENEAENCRPSSSLEMPAKLVERNNPFNSLTSLTRKSPLKKFEFKTQLNTDNKLTTDNKLRSDNKLRTDNKLTTDNKLITDNKFSAENKNDVANNSVTDEFSVGSTSTTKANSPPKKFNFKKHISNTGKKLNSNSFNESTPEAGSKKDLFARNGAVSDKSHLKNVGMNISNKSQASKQLLSLKTPQNHVNSSKEHDDDDEIILTSSNDLAKKLNAKSRGVKNAKPSSKMLVQKELSTKKGILSVSKKSASSSSSNHNLTKIESNTKRNETTKYTRLEKHSNIEKLQLNDTVSEISDCLKPSDADFMDDDEFELLFGGNVSEPVVPNNLKPAISNNLKAAIPNNLKAAIPNNLKAAIANNLKPAVESELNDLDLQSIIWDDFDAELPSNKNDSSVIVVSDKKDPSIDEVIDLSDVNFEEDVFGEFKADEHAESSFGIRKDHAHEFRKVYPHTEVMNEVLHQKFGLRNYRPHQQEIINASLMGHDCFILMPTGGGKSLCYQLPATLTCGVTIVISPLRALISDQVDKLNALDISAAHLCGDLSKAETEIVLAKLSVREPEIKLLYLTPEKMSASRNCGDLLDSLYKRDKLARFVIDECHCLSQWGHDFRPDYKQLSCLRQKFPKVPIMCLTATATHQVQGDVTSILKLRNLKTFIRSFNRPNIKYKVLPKTARVVDEIASLIRQKFYKKSGIIYCLSRDDCERLASDLCKLGVKAKAYHAGMSSKIRDLQQKQWMQDQFHVIVATIAFGMGIDKPDVRFVIHNSVPKSVEAFYQESGRGGRDGEVSYSYLFYNYGDAKRLQRLIRMENNKNTMDGHFENLRQMVSYCENVVDCRRYLQLIHLGETFDRQICMKDKTTICDNCENFNKHQILDVTDRCKQLCEIVRDISRNENVTMLHVAEIYKGSKAKKLLEKGHDKHPLYGKGSNLDRQDIHRILKQMILQQILSENCTFNGDFPVVYVKLGPKITKLNSNTFKFTIATVKEISNEKALKIQINKDPGSSTPTKEPSSPIPSTSGVATPSNKMKLEMNKLHVTCHEELLEECRRLALERNGTLSSIMNLSAIKNMADTLPNNKEDFMKIQHVTKANYEKFGDYFLKITTKYRQKVDALSAPKPTPIKPLKSTQSISSANDDDWWYDSQSEAKNAGVKRKSTGAGFKWSGKNKKFKAGGKRRPKQRKRKQGSPAKQKSNSTAKKRKVTKSSSKGKLGLMPVVHYT